MARYFGLFGIAAAVLFVTADLAGSILTPDYPMMTDAISELIERGAPFKHVVEPDEHRASEDARRKAASRREDRGELY